MPNVVWHPPVTMSALRSVYQHIDVLLLPQDVQPAAQVQLPAKLCDALQFRRVVLATPTPAIREVAGVAFESVSDWREAQEEYWRAVRRAALRHSDHTDRVDRVFSDITVANVARRTAPVLMPWNA